MAHQYVTYLIIFTLGLGLVVASAQIFGTLNSQFQQNTADLQLKYQLRKIKDKISSLILNGENKADYKSQIKLQLPTHLGSQYTYSISFFVDENNVWYLQGTINGLEIVKSTKIPNFQKTFVGTGSFTSNNGILVVDISINATTILCSLYSLSNQYL